MPEETQSNTSSKSAAASAVDLTPGTLINDKYQIVSLIGRGGMGSVYKVHQVFLGKEFALKVLDLHKRSDVSVRRFQQEARTASQLQHPNLVEVHDFGMIVDEQPYLVMDLIEGETLSHLLKSKGALSVDYVVALAIQISFGLLYAHDKGVVHRDIKPANILLLHPEKDAVEGTVKIVDFGIAKLTQSENGQIQSLTQTGEIFGSPLYMSPEQCKGATVDQRSDIYSLGCVMFECLTGSPPFYGDTAMSTMLKRLSEEPVSLKEGSLGSEFPTLLENIVRKMLMVEPDDRYQNLKDVVKDLMALQNSESIVVLLPKKAGKAPDVAAAQKKFSVVAVAILACVATAAFDRLVVFPTLLQNQEAHSPSEKSGTAPGVAGRASELVSAQVSTEHEAESDEDLQKENRSIIENPRVETRKSPDGKSFKILFFPTLIGKVSINGFPRGQALLDIPLPPDAKVDIRLNRTASEEEGILSGLTGVNVVVVGYNRGANVTNKTIEILNKFKNLECVRLEGSKVTSLAPIYEADKLTTLEVARAPLTVSELEKVRRFGALNSLSVGPIESAGKLFAALGRTKAITELRFDGTGEIVSGTNKGLNHDDVEKLAELEALKNLNIDACSDFDDDALAKLALLPNLSQLKIRDCALSGTAVSILKKFPRLSFLELTTTGWSDAERARLKTLPFTVNEVRPRIERLKHKETETRKYARPFIQ